MSQERTFIAVKPDGVQRGLTGEIIKRFEAKGFKMVAMKFLQASEDHLKKHYEDLADKPFFAGLVKYMASGPLVAMCWEGTGIVKTARQMMGETKPADSKPGTIRGDFCIEVGRNIIHGSDSVESANKEISLWFKPEELVSWKQANHDWIYELLDLLASCTSKEGLSILNEYLKNKSYIQGYCPSQNDLLVLNNIAEDFSIKLYPHVYRWRKHIVAIREDIRIDKEISTCKTSQSKQSKENLERTNHAKKYNKSKSKELVLESLETNYDLTEVSEKELRNKCDEKDFDEQVECSPSSSAYTILLEIKPKDDDTDMANLEDIVRGVTLEGLTWGASQLSPIAYGMHKLSIICTLEDDRSSMQDILQKLMKYEDYVKDVNITAFNKL